jgi:Spy/CpxP family protein refolding chaperone
LQRADNRYKKYRKLAEIHDKYRAKIRKLLTAEQKTKFDKVDLRT